MIAESLDWEPPRFFRDWLARLDDARGDAAETRAICAALALFLPLQRIARGGAPYLDRYEMTDLGPNRGRILLHHFLAGDDAAHHNHPWHESRSVILAGGYIEDRHGEGTREHRPGTVNTITAGTYHRVDLIEHDAWTLFSTGPAMTPPVWGFLDPTTGRHVDFQRWRR